jgi:hypothetical protein
MKARRIRLLERVRDTKMILRPIMGPQTGILFSLGSSLQPNSMQQFVQIINDPLV